AVLKEVLLVEVLTGGGLIRSAGGWEEVKRMREAREFQKSDERLLGDGDFVEEVLRACDEKMERTRKRARKKLRNLYYDVIPDHSLMEIDGGLLWKLL
ncbi:MAG: hypothetical protein AB1512_27835, partial [Thermodesulfobacteriota bacterium]